MLLFYAIYWSCGLEIRHLLENKFMEIIYINKLFDNNPNLEKRSKTLENQKWGQNVAVGRKLNLENAC